MFKIEKVDQLTLVTDKGVLRLATGSYQGLTSLADRMTLENLFRARDLLVAAPEMHLLLKMLLQAWESIPESMQVPDEINDNKLWDKVREVLAELDEEGEVDDEADG